MKLTAQCQLLKQNAAKRSIHGWLLISTRVTESGHHKFHGKRRMSHRCDSRKKAIRLRCIRFAEGRTNNALCRRVAAICHRRPWTLDTRSIIGVIRQGLSVIEANRRWIINGDRHRAALYLSISEWKLSVRGHRPLGHGEKGLGDARLVRGGS